MRTCSFSEAAHSLTLLRTRSLQYILVQYVSPKNGLWEKKRTPNNSPPDQQSHGLPTTYYIHSRSTYVHRFIFTRNENDVGWSYRCSFSSVEEPRSSEIPAEGKDNPFPISLEGKDVTYLCEFNTSWASNPKQSIGDQARYTITGGVSTNKVKPLEAWPALSFLPKLWSVACSIWTGWLEIHFLGSTNWSLEFHS